MASIVAESGGSGDRPERRRSEASSHSQERRRNSNGSLPREQSGKRSSSGSDSRRDVSAIDHKALAADVFKQGPRHSVYIEYDAQNLHLSEEVLAALRATLVERAKENPTFCTGAWSVDFHEDEADGPTSFACTVSFDNEEDALALMAQKRLAVSSAGHTRFLSITRDKQQRVRQGGSRKERLVVQVRNAPPEWRAEHIVAFLSTINLDKTNKRSLFASVEGLQQQAYSNAHRNWWLALVKPHANVGRVHKIPSIIDGIYLGLSTQMCDICGKGGHARDAHPEFRRRPHVNSDGSIAFPKTTAGLALEKDSRLDFRPAGDSLEAWTCLTCIDEVADEPLQGNNFLSAYNHQQSDQHQAFKWSDAAEYTLSRCHRGGTECPRET